MVRRLLFLAFAVVLVVGLTFPASAGEKDDDDCDDDHDCDKKNQYVFFARCDCAWKVDIDVNYYFDYPIFCDGKIYKEFEVEYDITSIEVETTLVHPTHLKAICDLGKPSFSKGFKELSGGCEVEFCEIEFTILKIKRHYGHDD
jgi:hypothetical protein